MCKTITFRNTIHPSVILLLQQLKSQCKHVQTFFFIVSLQSFPFSLILPQFYHRITFHLFTRRCPLTANTDWLGRQITLQINYTGLRSPATAQPWHYFLGELVSFWYNNNLNLNFRNDRNSLQKKLIEELHCRLHRIQGNSQHTTSALLSLGTTFFKK